MRDIPKDTLIRASKGQMQAFETIYRESCGFVYSVALRITQSVEDAKEVTQDVFLKIHKNLERFRFRASFKTWVYRITANTAINYYRKKSKENTKRVDFDAAIATKGTEGEAQGNIEAKDAKQKLSHLLGMLNPDQRACIVLREIEGLSYEEIAKALKININTVRSRLKRARQALFIYGQKKAVSNEV